MGEVPRYTTIRPNCGLKAWSPHCSSDRRSTASDTEHFEGHTQIAGGSSCRRNVQEATPSAFQGRSTVFRCQIEVLATGNDVRVRSSRGSSDLLIRGKDVEPAADTGLACPAEAHGRDNRTSSLRRFAATAGQPPRAFVSGGWRPQAFQVGTRSRPSCNRCSGCVIRWDSRHDKTVLGSESAQ